MPRFSRSLNPSNRISPAGPISPVNPVHPKPSIRGLKDQGNACCSPCSKKGLGLGSVGFRKPMLSTLNPKPDILKTSSCETQTKRSWNPLNFTGLGTLCNHVQGAHRKHPLEPQNRHKAPRSHLLNESQRRSEALVPRLADVTTAPLTRERPALSRDTILPQSFA